MIIHAILEELNIKMNKKLIAYGMLCSMSWLSFAQQQTDSIQIEQLNEVVITDSRFNLNRENSGKMITKITQQELNHLQGKTIAEIINTTTGVEINGTKSNAGQNLAYYVRGGRNRQVLVLIDGIAVTDPSQIANDYDLRLLNPDQVESIEILKGASSTLYGSGAATAVINIKLKEASKNKIAANFRSSLGSNQSQDETNFAIEDFRNSVSLNGTFAKFNYLASFGNQYTNGLSSISKGTEPDAFNSINGNLKLGYHISENFNLNTYASFDKFKSEFDDVYSRIDTDDFSKTNQYRLGISPEFNYKNGSLNLNFAYNNVKREIVSSYPGKYNAESYVADIFNKYKFNKKVYSVFGINLQRNSMESFTIPFGSTELQREFDPAKAHFTIADPYLNVVYVSDFGLNINSGVRLNNHSEYGSHLVYSLNPSFRNETNFGYLKLHTSYSTAYIVPSLYQLFEPNFGNADLKPEKNRTIEAGLEMNFKNKANFSLVYFNRREQNFIDFLDLGNFAYQYKNVDTDFTASGLEFSSNYKFSEKMSWVVNATYTKVEENLNLRIPKFKVNVRMDYQILNSTFFSLAYQFNDDRNDLVFNSSTFTNDKIVLQHYSLLNAYLSHTILKNKMTVFANFTNILNEDYEEIYGYSTKGRNISIGFDLKF